MFDVSNPLIVYALSRLSLKDRLLVIEAFKILSDELNRCLIEIESPKP